MKTSIAYIALGSNLGNRQENINDAIRRLGSLAFVDIIRVSQLIDTLPVGGPADQGNFLNGAAKISCSAAPEELLDALLLIENELGRVRSEKWGPRTIDLDLLFFGEYIIQTPRLTVPHPLLHERPFVLIPLAEIAPNLVHPLFDKTITQLLNEIQ